jgi:hypothetical protein
VRWTGQVHDISSGGLALVLGRRFEPRTVLAVDLDAPEKGRVRRLFVRVVRAHALSPRRWLHGCVFARRLSDEEVQALV